jgi:hypothetical protein
MYTAGHLLRRLDDESSACDEGDREQSAGR